MKGIPTNRTVIKASYSIDALEDPVEETILVWEGVELVSLGKAIQSRASNVLERVSWAMMSQFGAPKIALTGLSWRIVNNNRDSFCDAVAVKSGESSEVEIKSIVEMPGIPEVKATVVAEDDREKELAVLEVNVAGILCQLDRDSLSALVALDGQEGEASQELLGALSSHVEEVAEFAGIVGDFVMVNAEVGLSLRVDPSDVQGFFRFMFPQEGVVNA